ncbi:MAG: methylenetetrahydrofolate reductase [NAD(P)H] [Gammaproteobacteria bacterium]|nr:MAG: methylenetetrahydrofolate reductase [NAD(P)H] [Gammaproteobacteria bacterium]RLA13491.1 MAG: methylenetetrahydrofolate reductase [NAD(P)H] [Gammaproteobacteria bacterium]
MKSQRDQPRRFSLEFFPTKTPEGADKVRAVRNQLAQLAPDYFSVTFGAGGSTRDGTIETVREISDEGAVIVAPHLSCVGSTRQEITDLVEGYRQMGVKNLVALRGDLPSGTGYGGGDFPFANDLVTFLREQWGDEFHIEVAAYPEFHPQAESAEADLLNFKRKVAAGADAAITQYFYNADAYFGFIDSIEKLGVEIPVVPGIMPITNFTQLARFSDACGAEIPRWIRRKLEAFGDDMAALRDFGHEVTLQLCQRLLEQGAPGLHFYSMNRLEPCQRLWTELGLSDPD